MHHKPEPKHDLKHMPLSKLWKSDWRVSYPNLSGSVRPSIQKPTYCHHWYCNESKVVIEYICSKFNVSLRFLKNISCINQDNIEINQEWLSIEFCTFPFLQWPYARKYDEPLMSMERTPFPINRCHNSALVRRLKRGSTRWCKICSCFQAYDYKIISDLDACL